VERAALTERQTKRYRNQTGNLQRSTQGVVTDRSLVRTSVDLVMGMYYASYVEEKGLSNIRDVYEIARAELHAFLRHLHDA
jgi:hypothetical protein